jgi:hypothetical protein
MTSRTGFSPAQVIPSWSLERTPDPVARNAPRFQLKSAAIEIWDTEELALAHADGTYTRLLGRLAKIDVLVLDDWGLAPLREQGRIARPILFSDMTGVIGKPTWNTTREGAHEDLDTRSWVITD